MDENPKLDPRKSKRIQDQMRAFREDAGAVDDYLKSITQNVFSNFDAPSRLPSPQDFQPHIDWSEKPGALDLSELVRSPISGKTSNVRIQPRIDIPEPTPQSSEPPVSEPWQAPKSAFSNEEMAPASRSLDHQINTEPVSADKQATALKFQNPTKKDGTIVNTPVAKKDEPFSKISQDKSKALSDKSAPTREQVPEQVESMGEKLEEKYKKRQERLQDLLDPDRRDGSNISTSS